MNIIATVHKGQIEADSDDRAAELIIDQFPGAIVTIEKAQRPGYYTWTATILERQE